MPTDYWTGVALILASLVIVVAAVCALNAVIWFLLWAALETKYGFRIEIGAAVAGFLAFAFLAPLSTSI